MTSGVYRIICELTDDFYIGSSQNIEKRIKGHLGPLKDNKQRNIFIWKINKRNSTNLPSSTYWNY